MKKEEATKLIALALAVQAGHSVPTLPDWSEARYLSTILVDRGHIEVEEPNAWELHGLTEEQWAQMSLTERVHYQTIQEG